MIKNIFSSLILSYLDISILLFLMFYLYFLHSGALDKSTINRILSDNYRIIRNQRDKSNGQF